MAHAFFNLVISLNFSEIADELDRCWRNRLLNIIDKMPFELLRSCEHKENQMNKYIHYLCEWHASPIHLKMDCRT